MKNPPPGIRRRTEVPFFSLIVSERLHTSRVDAVLVTECSCSTPLTFSQNDQHLALLYVFLFKNTYLSYTVDFQMLRQVYFLPEINQPS